MAKPKPSSRFSSTNASTTRYHREALEQALAAFVTYYNYYRLHGSLGFRPPATRY